MASLASRRTHHRKTAEHLLEKGLDAMHATKEDRVLARRTFASMVDKSAPVTLNTGIRRALEAVGKERARRADATTGAA